MTRTKSEGIALAIGVSGSGKTYAIRELVFGHLFATNDKVLVVDRMREWDSVPAFLKDTACHVPSVEIATKAFADGRRLCIVGTSNASAVTEEACAWALANRGAVALPEAHRAAPNAAPLSPALEDAVCAWRHFGVTMWLDTQRIALLSRTITEQARTILVFATTGDRDRSVLRDLGGKELESAAVEAGRRMAEGEAGWHVRLGLIRTPPYELVRL